MDSNDAQWLDDIVEDIRYDVREDGTIWRYLSGSSSHATRPRWKQTGLTTSARKGYYVVQYAGRPLLVHRVVYRKFIGPLPVGVHIDHRDNNGYNNVPTNLRVASVGQNRTNADKYTDCSSSYKGVTWFAGKWVTYIQMQYIGRFEDEIEAARAYDQEARKRFGEFARLNLPTSTSDNN